MNEKLDWLFSNNIGTICMDQLSSSSTVKIGLMVPLTGIVRMYGPEVSRAAQIACKEINDAGGILGKN